MSTAIASVAAADAAILGLLGCFLTVRLILNRVHTGVQARGGGAVQGARRRLDLASRAAARVNLETAVDRLSFARTSQ